MTLGKKLEKKVKKTTRPFLLRGLFGRYEEFCKIEYLSTRHLLMLRHYFKAIF